MPVAQIRASVDSINPALLDALQSDARLPVVENRDILGGIIGALPMVERTHSYFVMEEVKEGPVLALPRGPERRP